MSGNLGNSTSYRVAQTDQHQTFKICLNIPDKLKRIVCKALNHDINFFLNM